MHNITELTTEAFLDLVTDKKDTDIFKSKTQGYTGNIQHIIKINEPCTKTLTKKSTHISNLEKN